MKTEQTVRLDMSDLIRAGEQSPRNAHELFEATNNLFSRYEMALASIARNLNTMTRLQNDPTFKGTAEQRVELSKFYLNSALDTLESIGYKKEN